jgi:hypothetical protein
MNDRLRADLSSGADAFDLPPADLGAVVQRARHRNRRRQRLTGTAAALAVVAATVTTYRLANPADHDTTSVASETSSAHLGDSGIEWASGDGTATLVGNSAGTALVGGTTYALSTEPGKRAPEETAPRALWRSADGLTWEQAAMPGFSANRLAGTDGRLYAIGTGPATTGSAVHIGWSDGGDGPWQDQVLPLDVSDLASKADGVAVVPLDVAATDDAVVGLVRVAAHLDLRKVLPGEAAPHGWYLADDGIDVLGDGPGCPAGTTETNPAAEVKRQQAAGEGIAVGPETERAPVAGEQQYETSCFSADGTATSHEPTELYGVASHHSFDELGITGDARLAVLGQAFVFRADAAGGEFHRVDAGAMGEMSQVEATGDGFVLAASSPKGQVTSVLRSTDGETWQPDATFPATDWISAFGTVDGHPAFVSSDREGGLFGQLVDGTWQTTSLTSLVGASKGSWVGTAGIGPLGVVAVVGEPKRDDTNTSILASRDGQTWSRTPLADLLGGQEQGGYLDRVVIRDDRAVLTGSIFTNGRTEHIAVVGTPR